jgi:hypothetical protein
LYGTPTVIAVHVIPLEEYAAAVVVARKYGNPVNVVPVTARPPTLSVDGIVVAVHVIPLVEYAAVVLVPLELRAT